MKTLSEIRAIVFDADNTLYKTKGVAKIADMDAMKVLAKQSKRTPKKLYSMWAEVVSAVKKSSNPADRTRKHSYSLLLGKLGIADERVLQNMLSAFEKTLLSKMKLSPQVLKTLQNLKMNYKLFVVSEENGEMLVKKLSKFGLLGYFNAVISSSHTGAMKPSEKYYKLLKNISGLGYKKFAVIGDSFENDLKIPKKLGMTTVLLGKEEPAHFCVGKISELEEILHG